MNTLDIYKLSKDIRHLYGSTKSSIIEAEYIRVSQTFESSFLKWLSNNNPIRSELKNQIVYSTLLTLKKMKEQYPDSISVSDYMSFFHNKKGDKNSLMSIMSIMSTMGTLLGTDVEPILSPFNHILSLTSTFKSNDIISPEDILEDLRLIRDKFAKSGKVQKDTDSGIGQHKKFTKQQKNKLMFSALLKMFSNEIANAADQNGILDLASSLRNGDLAKLWPYGIGKYVQFSKPINMDVSIPKSMVDYVMKYNDSKFMDWNHRAIQIAFLRNIGAFTEDDIASLRSNIGQSTSVSQYMEETYEPSQEEEIETDILNPEQDKIISDNRLNPRYLFMLSNFFTMLYSKIDPRALSQF